MRQAILGFIALACLLAGLIALRWNQDASSAGMAGLCLRVGLVLGVIWLALPQLARLRLWHGGLLLAALVIIAWKPLLALAVLPAIALVWFLAGRAR